MITLKQRFMIDEQGNRAGVVLDMADYQKLLEELEELESLHAYDRAKASGDPAIPLDQAIAEIEARRK